MNDTPSPFPCVTLAELLARRRIDAHRVQFDITDDWLQGRTTYGGVTAAIGLQAMRDAAAAWPPDVRLHALQTSFVAPITLGAVDVEVTVLREGKNVRQLQAVLRQNGVLSTVLLGVFGAPRDTAVPPLVPRRPHVNQAPDDIPSALPMGARRPQFLHHFDMRWAEGGLPGSGHGAWHARIHIRVTDADIASVHPEIVTTLVADALPSPASSWLAHPAPASSVSWGLELSPLAEDEPLAGWWRADAEVVAARNGYTNSQVKIWSPSGALAALSYQVLALFG